MIQTPADDEQQEQLDEAFRSTAGLNFVSQIEDCVYSHKRINDTFKER